MTDNSHDVIVVGLGATGGATAYHLAKRGVRVLGIDRFAPPHARGSSHGHTRIYRQAYYEAPAYVPLALRALELWHELEAETGRTLFSNTGVLTIGARESEIVAGALRSAREHGIAHETLAFDEITRRFPAYHPPDNAIGVFEPTGGVLFPDLCVESHLTLARQHGAELRLNETVQRTDTRSNDSVVVHTDAGSYSAAQVVIAAGAWAPALLRLEGAFRVTREAVHWFDPLSKLVDAPECPVGLIAMDDGRMLYTIPNYGDGFKAGLHHTGVEASPDVVPNGIDVEEREGVRRALMRHAPDGAGKVRESAHCYYTTTADYNFAMGRMPGAPAVILAAACSGHGFKFATALGEGVAGMVMGEGSGLPEEVFAVGRLGGS